MKFRLAGRHYAPSDPLPAEADRLPKIRLFEVTCAAELRPASTVAGRWVVCSREAINKFSGVAYDFISA